jgi:peroxiredoxin Q/BCP
MKPLSEKGALVVSVSGDSARTLNLFKKQNKLNYTLLSDEKGELAKKFGVPTRPGGERTVKVDGKDVKVTQGVYAARWTFVIGKDGTIIHKNPKASAADDSKDILKLLDKK